MILLLAIICIGFSLQAQEVVNNQGVKRQVESMVVTKWSKRYFRPKLYYQLVHNAYRRGRDRRLIHHLAPTLVAAKNAHNETEDEANEVDKDWQDELAIAADKEFNTKYNLLYRDHFNELFLKLYSIDLRSSLEVIEGYNGNVFQQSEHVLLIENFEERKQVIDESYSPSVEKNLEYDALIADMEKYISTVLKLKRKLAAYNKYAPMLQNQPIEN